MYVLFLIDQRDSALKSQSRQFNSKTLTCLLIRRYFHPCVRAWRLGKVSDISAMEQTVLHTLSSRKLIAVLAVSLVLFVAFFLVGELATGGKRTSLFFR